MKNATSGAVDSSRVAFGFGLGGVVALAVMAFLPGLIFGFLAGVFPMAHGLLPTFAWLGQVLGFFADGAIGGASMQLNRRTTLALGMGFAAGAYFIQRTFAYVRLMPGGDSLGAILYCSVMFAVGFGLAAAVGGVLAGHPFTLTGRSAAGFATGGALGGALLPLPVVVPLAPWLATLESLLLMVVSLAAFLLPHFIGGMSTGRALEDYWAQGRSGL